MIHIHINHTHSLMTIEELYSVHFARLKLSNEGHIHPRNSEMCLTQMIDRYMREKIDLHKLFFFFYLDFTVACVHRVIGRKKMYCCRKLRRIANNF